jgi:hypothetical protein
VSAVADALKAVRDALLLADQVKRLGEALGAKDLEIRQLDRRVTRLEAQWDTAMSLTGARPKLPPLGHDDDD